MQDLDAALPIIEKYKDHLVAIGEVMFQYLRCDLIANLALFCIHVNS